MAQQPQHQSGPPYASTVASAGGLPTPGVDIPILAVLIVLYLSGAATNMTILQKNNRKGHKFLISGALFGFCMARTATCVLRIAWATRQHNVRLGMASSIFVNAGILIIYIVNIILSQRILRAKQPRFGWNPIVRAVYKALYVLTGVALIVVIVSIVLSSYTLDMHIKHQCRDMQLAGSTFLLVLTTVPWFALAAAHFLPSSHDEEHFGHGSMNKKTMTLFLSSSICVLMAGFKTGSAWMPPRPANNPPWYDSKAGFYIFYFALEIVVLIVLVGSRIDKRFHVPNGSKGPGDYSQHKIESPNTTPKLSMGGDSESDKERLEKV